MPSNIREYELAVNGLLINKHSTREANPVLTTTFTLKAERK